MQKIKLSDIEGMKFPTGRHTRVLVGADSPVQAEHFTMGYVKIEPDGSVPMHEHEQEEVYFIVKGNGTIELDNEIFNINEGTAVYIPPFKTHELVNTGAEEMIMMFVYAPAGIVDHWDEERK